MLQNRRFKNPVFVLALALTGKTGCALARECGIHPVTLSHILNNRVRPKPRTAKLIARSLNVNPEKLFPGYSTFGGEA